MPTRGSSAGKHSAEKRVPFSLSPSTRARLRQIIAANAGRANALVDQIEERTRKCLRVELPREAIAQFQASRVRTRGELRQLNKAVEKLLTMLEKLTPATVMAFSFAAFRDRGPSASLVRLKYEALLVAVVVLRMRPGQKFRTGPQVARTRELIAAGIAECLEAAGIRPTKSRDGRYARVLVEVLADLRPYGIRAPEDPLDLLRGGLDILSKQRAVRAMLDAWLQRRALGGRFSGES